MMVQIKKFSHRIIIIFIFFQVSSAQLYFPDDNERSSSLGISPAPYLSRNLSEIRGTSMYDTIVNEIISSGVTSLTLSINNALGDAFKNSTDNFAYAPVSIAGCLALILLGANGNTFREISTIMGLATGVDIETKSEIVHEQFGRMIRFLEDAAGFELGTHVSFATAIFVQQNYPIRELYKSTAERVYQSEVLNLDFQSDPEKSQQAINAWVSDRTNGKISNILSDAPDFDTKVIMASAMYFKAKWEKPFFDELTHSRPFYPDGKHGPSNIIVDMMVNGDEFPYYKDTVLNCEIIGFPYKGNRTTMYVVKPFDSNKNKLRSLEAALTPSEINRLVSSTKYSEVIVVFPKMTIESSIDLKSALYTMGIQTLFDPAESNLALVSPGQNASFASASPDIPIALNIAGDNPLQPIGVENQSQLYNMRNDQHKVLIFSRSGDIVNCGEIFNPNSTVATCESTLNATSRKVIYKKFDDKVGRRIIDRRRRNVEPATDTLDTVRQQLNANPDLLQNPGLYASKVIHKVFIEITETGTEAAASTATSLSKSGGKIGFRADVPFLFFIFHEETKMILFWGSVNTPTPHRIDASQS